MHVRVESTAVVALAYCQSCTWRALRGTREKARLAGYEHELNGHPPTKATRDSVSKGIARLTARHGH